MSLRCSYMASFFKETDYFQMFGSLLKRGLLHMGRICFPWKQILSFKSRPLVKEALVCRKANRKSQKVVYLVKMAKNLSRVFSPINVAEINLMNAYVVV